MAIFTVPQKNFQVFYDDGHNLIWYAYKKQDEAEWIDSFGVRFASFHDLCTLGLNETALYRHIQAYMLDSKYPIVVLFLMHKQVHM